MYPEDAGSRTLAGLFLYQSARRQTKDDVMLLGGSNTVAWQNQ
jgi:hypothetical protein